MLRPPALDARPAGRVAVAAVLMSAAAAAIHAAVTLPHFGEYAPFGLRFGATALAQAAWAALMISLGTAAGGRGGLQHRHRRCVGLSRTVGLPSGPAAGRLSRRPPSTWRRRRWSLESAAPRS